MLKKNKGKIILSSILILLPALFGAIVWNDLPDMITTHWDAGGNADSMSGKAFAVFGLPCILLALHFVCLLFTQLDKKQKEQNPKALGIIFWIIPTVSLLSNGIMYSAVFGRDVDLTLLGAVLCGVMFVFIGNYLPKIKPNRTLGIKVSWTLNNEENWNKTHRFGGKVWVISGLAFLPCAFLPVQVFAIAMPCIIAVAIGIPILYSYLLYKKHRKQGIVYDSKPAGKAEKVAVKITAIIVPIILIWVAVLMFTGDIEVNCEDSAFTVHATYYTDLEVDYSEIESISYRKDLDVGVRTSGFASAKLYMGIFQNEELGTYTLYAYADAKEFIVLTSQGKTMVIGLQDAQDTQAIYNSILCKLNERKP